MDWWARGQKSKLAEAAGISRAHLCDLIASRRHATYEMALRLEAASHKIGLTIPWDCWLGHVRHPALRGRG